MSVPHPGKGPGWCIGCGKAQTTEEAIHSDYCSTCDDLLEEVANAAENSQEGPQS